MSCLDNYDQYNDTQYNVRKIQTNILQKYAKIFLKVCLITIDSMKESNDPKDTKNAFIIYIICIISRIYLFILY